MWSEPIKIGYVSLKEFDFELFERNMIVFNQPSPRNDLLKLFASKSSLYCTSIIIQYFPNHYHKEVLLLLLYLYFVLAFSGNW